uniref:Uncharacterized protein n=1 Tax=viral metagenome TaxID=1070528 RepID=A0A6M3JKH6_9ZZZZ
MLPYEEIKIGDIYSKPMHRGYGKYSGLEYYVIDKKEKMVKLQPVTVSGKLFGKPVWMKNTNKLFSKTGRIAIGNI